MKSNMTIPFAAIAVLVSLFIGIWVAKRIGLDRTSNLPEQLGRLEQHFVSQGIQVESRLVKNIFPDIRFHSHFKVLGNEERVFFVLYAKTPEAAQSHLSRLLNAPSKSLPEVNGNLVIYLTDWDAADPITQKVIAAFKNFSP